MDDLTLIFGPMKSGKSYELISHFAPLQYTDIPFGLFHSVRNVRDQAITSRNGATLIGQKIKSLKSIVGHNYQLVGIDEVHMFEPEDVAIVADLLKNGTAVLCSGLDMDYRGELFETVKRLLELGPKEVRYKRSVCEVCRQPNAVYTQVFNQGQPIITGLPSVLPEDGTYTYEPVCRDCFRRK